MTFFYKQMKIQKFVRFKILITKEVSSNKTHNCKEIAHFKTLKTKQKFRKIIYQTVHKMSLLTFQHLVHQKGLAKMT
jgi:hypothetical protein